jgi:YrbI family 3-deoxy-D-manno-octulosonate 8-phosphate phosphatase
MDLDMKTKLKKIKLVITDVDGVLTDGGMYYNQEGECMKKFNTKDSMGMELLLQNQIKSILLTRENSKIVKERAKKIKIIELYSNILKKEVVFPQILKKYKVSDYEVAYIGDDINDIEIMKLVGFSATPLDGNYAVKKISDYICKINGGQGVFREISDLIIQSKNN